MATSNSTFGTSIRDKWRGARSDCCNPNDRIFALLGLAADAQELANTGLKVSYKNSASLTYQETARAMIAIRNPDILSYCQFPKFDASMPSWVPD
jgi:hypothetical protein